MSTGMADTERVRKELLTKGAKKRKLIEGLWGYAFMIPTLIGFSLFIIYPLIASGYYSLCEYSGFGKEKFVGFKNFIWMFTKDPTFGPAIRATLKYVVFTVPALLIFGLLLALLLNKTMSFVKVFRAIYYLPVVVPAVASLVLWKFIFSPDYGLVNGILASLGLPTSRWLEDNNMVMVALTIIVVWGCGSQMIIFLSGLQSVPAELYEAAVVDGASGSQQFFYVTVPMMTPILFLQLITGLIGGFQVINPALVITIDGSPNLKTFFLNFAIYKSAFDRREYGYAMALVWVLFFIIMFFTIIIYRISDAYVYYESEN